MFFCYSVLFFSDKVTKEDRCFSVTLSHSFRQSNKGRQMFFLLFCLIFSDKVTHLFKIEMLETTVSGIMEEHHNQHHLCLRGIAESW